MLYLTWMEAKSCKSSCCRRGGMDEDWMTSSKTSYRQVIDKTSYNPIKTPRNLLTYTISISLIFTLVLAFL